MDANKRNWILVILGILFLISLTCAAIYTVLRNQANREAAQQTRQTLQAQVVSIATSTSQPTIAALAEAAIQATATSQPVTSLWRFIKFNQKEVGLFESVDTPGQILKALCQQPKVPPPTWGELYRLGDQGILTPVNEKSNVQIFKIK